MTVSNQLMDNSIQGSLGKGRWIDPKYNTHTHHS